MKIKEIKKFFINKTLQPAKALKNHYLYFIPTVILFLAGLFSFFDRSYLPAMISVAICSIGVLFTLITYKAVILFMAIKDILNKINAQVIFYPSSSSDNKRNSSTQILDLLDDESDPWGKNFH